jgi:DNA primase
MIQSFDLIKYLQEKNIEYQTEGKNVSEGWTEVNCPFCQDLSFHLGISPDLKLNCWICGTKGNITKYIQEIERCSYNFAQRITEKYQDRTLKYLDKKERQSSSFVKLPTSAKPLQKIHKDYLINRNFDPDFLEKKYDLLGCSEIGDYKFRIIVPIYLENKLVTFIGRDVTNKSKLRYKNCPVEQSILPTKSVLYNLDSVNKKMVIVEGVTDVWRIGDGCVATLGTQYTKKQLSLLLGIKQAFILFDQGAEEQADRLAFDLSIIVPKVEVLSLNRFTGDPASLSTKEVNYLRKDLGL